MPVLKFDVALDILSNSYRREILRLLTSSDHYAFELSKMLNISQRAIKNHLDFLKEVGLVETEKRPSSKGPDREYFKLSQAVIISLTMAPNLFRTSVRALSEVKASQIPITPLYQLDVPKNAELKDVIKEGLQLLPQISEGLDLLQIQQAKLLRAYQGLQAHMTDVFEKQGLSSGEIRLLLLVIENEGAITDKEIEINLGKITYLTDTITRLEQKNLIKTEIIKEDNITKTKISLLNQ